MADSRMRGRVKGLLGAPSADDGPMMEPMPEPPSPDAQRQALQVLTLAQKTADEHVASAQRQAENIRASAQKTAEQIVRDAQAHADGTRRDAEKALVDARAQATEIAKDAQAKAAELEREAQKRYDDVVGSLETKRAALQEQIEALQKFDREYRSRLRTFMQRQLHELGPEEPAAGAQMQGPGDVAMTMAPRGPER